MKKQELMNLSVAELEKTIADMRRELFELKISLPSGQVKDYSQISKVRKNIARGLTFLNQKAASSALVTKAA